MRWGAEEAAAAAADGWQLVELVDVAAGWTIASDNSLVPHSLALEYVSARFRWEKIQPNKESEGPSIYEKAIYWHNH